MADDEQQYDDENAGEDVDPNDIALALMQGLCCQDGMDPMRAASLAWHAVPAFYAERQKFAERQQQALEEYNAQQEQGE